MAANWILYFAVAGAVAGSSALSSSEVSGDGLALLQLNTKRGQGTEKRQGGGRAVMFAGIEGTGHHLWWELFEGCSAGGACLPMSHSFNCAAGGEGECHLGTWWADLQLRADGPLGLIFVDSYPCCGSGPGEKVVAPDLVPVYKEAQKNHDRLKVLVLLRSVRSLLWADYSRFAHGAEIEIEGARVLKEQLEQVRPEDRICLDWEALPDMASAMEEVLAEWPGANNFNWDWKGALDEKFDKERATEECKDEDADKCQSTELEGLMADLRTLCASSPHLFASDGEDGSSAMYTVRTWTPKEVWQAIFEN